MNQWKILCISVYSMYLHNIYVCIYTYIYIHIMYIHIMYIHIHTTESCTGIYHKIITIHNPHIAGLQATSDASPSPELSGHNPPYPRCGPCRFGAERLWP